MRVYRTDYGALGRVEPTASGGLRVPGVVARVGVLRYSNGTREWGELVPPETLGDPASLATLRGAPVTVGHPQAPVTPETWPAVSRGHVGDDPRLQGEDLAASVLVQSADAVRAVAAGELVELSAGYVCDVEPGAGVWNGEAYDAVQTHRRYNHVALLPPGSARAGPGASLRMDGSAYQVPALEGARSGTTMKEIKIRGKAYRLDAEPEMAQAQEAIGAVEKKADADLAELSAVKDALMKALQQVASMEAKLTAASAAQPAPVTEEMVPEEVLDSALVKRAALIDRARRVLGDADLKGQKPSQIRRAVVAKAVPGVRLDGLSEDTLTGMFLAATETAQNSALATLHRDAAGDPGVAREDDDGDLSPAAALAARTHRHFEESRKARKAG